MSLHLTGFKFSELFHSDGLNRLDQAFLARRKTKYFLKVAIGLCDVVNVLLIDNVSSMLNKRARNSSRIVAQAINSSLI